ncbi:MAG: phosphoribosylformylglycinamidine synthase I [Spirochaetales bacterium]|nr:phosphoribosylformylglycinamidine synthase I [Spirochaetales bacterium]MDP6487879.1 phosphoribosylformylglycinamidine synthase subunit PurQ [SAR324 cluster bacterium]MDP6521326.1 phosphoribosylformylglycinamidine synthase subunit PurQ [SAR324 cluster bacterium]
MQCAVIVFPGSNCDFDLFKAVNSVEGMKAEYVWYTVESLEDYDAVLLPGGFSYGDALRVGALAAQAPVLKAIRSAADKGVYILGICNGFQILTECGLLPGALHRNSGLRFICDTVSLQVVNTETPFTRRFIPDANPVRMPVAHGEGNYTCDNDTLKKLEDNGQIVFRYFGNNLNGSVDNIAGISNSKGNVLGMMPHPERAMAEWMGSTDGRILFESLLT